MSLPPVPARASRQCRGWFAGVALLALLALGATSPAARAQDVDPLSATVAVDAAPADEPGKPVILIPVYQSGAQSLLWEDPNPWRQAWDEQPPVTGGGAPRLVVPLGDAGDIAAIDAEKARAGDAGGLAGIARRNGGDDTIVAIAALRGP